MEIPERTPSSIIAGDTVQWIESLPDFPSPGWALSVVMVNASGQIIISSSQYLATSSHLVAETSANSANWVPGEYSYVIRLSKGTEVYTVSRGVISVTPNITASDNGLDTRTWAKRCLDNIDATMEGRASQSQLAYTIAGRQLQHMTHAELIEARNYYAARVRAERAEELARQGKRRFGSVKIEFGPRFSQPFPPLR